ncbi:MATH and LRR domain-containing protein PFE0570w-like [Cotesia glomerata]|nr:MATH and LRR domain-containing protein PFE0570w-like [Cotesia glomerata]
MKPNKRADKKKRICQHRLVKKLNNHIQKLCLNLNELSNYLTTDVPTFQDGIPSNGCKAIKTYVNVIKKVHKGFKSLTAKSGNFLREVSELSLKYVPVLDLVENSEEELPQIKFHPQLLSGESSNEHKRRLSSEEEVPAKEAKVNEVLSLENSVEDDKEQEEKKIKEEEERKEQNEDEYLHIDTSSLENYTDEENDFEGDDEYYSSNSSDEDQEEIFTVIGKIIGSSIEENNNPIDLFGEAIDKDKLINIASCAAEFVYERNKGAKIIIITSQCQIENWFKKLSARKEEMPNEAKMFLYVLKNKFTSDFEEWKRVGGALLIEFDFFKQIYDHKTTDSEETSYRDAVFDQGYELLVLDLICPVDEWQSFFLKNIISIMTSSQKLILQPKKPSSD